MSIKITRRSFQAWVFVQDEATIGCKLCESGKYSSYGVTHCTFCAAGTYQNSSGASACMECPANSISPTGSVNVSSCRCKPGYVGSGGLPPCTPCPAGTYSASMGTGSTTCLACPTGSTSAEASNDLSDCQCGAGQHISRGVSSFVAGSGSVNCVDNTGNQDGVGTNSKFHYPWGIA